MDLILEQLGSTFSEDLFRSIILRRLAFKEWIMRVKSKKPCLVGICHRRCNKVDCERGSFWWFCGSSAGSGESISSHQGCSESKADGWHWGEGTTGGRRRSGERKWCSTAHRDGICNKTLLPGSTYCCHILRHKICTTTHNERAELCKFTQGTPNQERTFYRCRMNSSHQV